jgi:DNA-binding helix-hairpin-helix protein with protein kinase domain
MPIYKTENNYTVSTGKELGKGGEGIVYAINENPHQVAKIYYQQECSVDKKNKLQIMIDRPPFKVATAHALTQIPLTWPLELLYQKGKFAGYLMPKIGKSSSIFTFYLPNLRQKHHPAIDRRHLYCIAKNLADIMYNLHLHGYIIGDVNQKNILISKNVWVTLVDVDSFQVKSLYGEVFHCPVGVAEYTPPELQGMALKEVERTTNHDRFGLAILLFQLLMQGFHPFAGVPINSGFSTTEKFDLYCIKKGIFPYQSNPDFAPPPNAPRFNTLPDGLQRLFLRCFIKGHQYPDYRPTAYDWVIALNHC